MTDFNKLEAENREMKQLLKECNDIAKIFEIILIDSNIKKLDIISIVGAMPKIISTINKRKNEFSNFTEVIDKLKKYENT